MFIDPELKQPRDERGRPQPEAPLSWSVLPFTIVFVGGFWALVGLTKWLAENAIWAVTQKVWDVPFYQLVLGGMMLFTASVMLFHFRDVRNTIQVAWAQVAIGVTAGMFSIVSAPSIELRILSALVAMVTIADGIRIIKSITDIKK